MPPLLNLLMLWIYNIQNAYAMQGLYPQEFNHLNLLHQIQLNHRLEEVLQGL